MNFQPVSDLSYALFNPEAQLLVCTFQAPPESAREAWGTRAAGAFAFDWKQVRSLVIDLLNNPQIRVVVRLDSTNPQHGPAVAAQRSFWMGGHSSPAWGIAQIHLDHVRRFVDVYDEDCGMHGPLHPHWPERLRYGTEARTANASAASGASATGDVAGRGDEDHPQDAVAEGA